MYLVCGFRGAIVFYHSNQTTEGTTVGISKEAGSGHCSHLERQRELGQVEK